MFQSDKMSNKSFENILLGLMAAVTKRIEHTSDIILQRHIDQCSHITFVIKESLCFAHVSLPSAAFCGPKRKIF